MIVVIVLTGTNEQDAYGPFPTYEAADKWIAERKYPGWRCVARTLLSPIPENLQ